MVGTDNYKRKYPNKGEFTNNSGGDIIVKLEDNDDEGRNRFQVIKNGEKISGVDGYWDDKEKKWYKITDNIDVEVGPDGKPNWRPSIYGGTDSGLYESFMMLSMGRLKSETPEGWAKDPTQHPELFVKGGPNSSEGKEPENNTQPSTPAEPEDKDKETGDGNSTAPGPPDGNGEPSVPHLDDPSKKTPYNPDDDPDIPHLKDPSKKRPYNPFVDGLLDGLKGLFGTAGQDPIVLDLDGDGVETLSQDAGVFFDHDGV